MTVLNLVEQAVETARSRSVARVARRTFNPSIRNLIAQRAALYDAYVAPGEMVFDIGVGGGLHSDVFLACHFNVIGIEPNPNFRAAITREFECDPRFEFVPKKLSARAGLADIEQESGRPGDSDQNSRQGLLRKTEPPKRRWVEVTTLDAIIGKYGLPRLCKINATCDASEVLSGLSQPIPFVIFARDSGKPDVVSECLDRLSSISTIRVNLHCAHSETMLYPTWVSASVFSKVVDDRSLPADATCWVAMGHEELSLR